MQESSAVPNTEPRTTIGLIIGFFLGPLGIILGPLIGAFVGEMIFKDDLSYAFKAGFGSLLGFLTSIGLKFSCFVRNDFLLCEGADKIGNRSL